MGQQVYRLGAVGAGNIGRVHLKGIEACDRWQLAWVCDISDETLKTAGKIAPGARLTTRYEDLLEDPDLDAISINTLSNIRPELVRRALAAGKHVLCEKPLAPTAAEAEGLASDIAASGRLATVNLINRNASYLRTAYDWVSSGELGRLAVIRVDHVTCGRPVAERSADTHKAVEGHVLHDCGMHYVDVARWFADSEYASFITRAVRMWEGEYELYCMVTGHFENGVLFDIHNSACYTTLAAEQRVKTMFEFIGTHGVISMDWVQETSEMLLHFNGRNRTETRRVPYGGKKLDVYYADFAAALETGHLGRLARPEDAVTASRVAQQMVDDALSRPIPGFGAAADLERQTTQPAR